MRRFNAFGDAKYEQVGGMRTEGLNNEEVWSMSKISEYVHWQSTRHSTVCTYQEHVWCRETREGQPLLTVKTEVNWNSKSTNEGGPALVGLLGLCCRYKRFLFCLGCSSQPIIKDIFFLTIHYFNSYVPIAQQAGQAAVLGRLSLSMCLQVWCMKRFCIPRRWAFLDASFLQWVLYAGVAWTFRSPTTQAPVSTFCTDFATRTL